MYIPQTKQVIVSRDVIFLSEVADSPAPEESFELDSDRMMQLESSTPVDSGRDGEVMVDIPSTAPGNTTDNDDESSEESELDSSVDETDYGSANDTVVTVSSPALPPQQEDPQMVVRRSARGAYAQASIQITI